MARKRCVCFVFMDIARTQAATTFGSALDTPNVTVKKQVFELLSALCVYKSEGYSRTSEGYNRALETLDHYKTAKNQRYRFKLAVDELRNTDDVKYQTALVVFINCVIISAADLKDRLRVRNEFIGLKFLDVISQLRKKCADATDSDLAVQLDVFDEQRISDESQLTGPYGVDLSSHMDVFYAILRQVADTPQEIPFLNILQHLLQVDSSQPISDIIWDTAERLVHRATLLETKADSEKLLRSPSSHHSLNKLRLADGRCMCSCHKTDDLDGRGRKVVPVSMGIVVGTRTPRLLSPTQTFNPVLPTVSTGPKPPSAPAPAPPPPPPPPPPTLPLPPGSTGPPKPPSGKPHPPPPPVPSNKPTDVTLPQQKTPRPRNKMKSLNWCKIPAHKVIGRDNLWARVAEAHNNSRNELDFDVMEGLFCQQSGVLNGQGSPRLGAREKTDSLERKKRDYQEVNLLDGKRSLNVNIFLKQFRSSNEEIISILQEGRHEDMGAERLRGLLKILPEPDEVELLKGYDGDKNKLGNAEKFLLQLIALPNYRLRIESMLLKEEFTASQEFLESALASIELASQEIRECKGLHEILYMVVVVGNFLNSGGYAGNAAGFKMMSLLKLTDIRANIPGMNLIHYVAAQAEKRRPELLKFPDLMPNLEDASKISTETLKADVAALSQKVSKISSQVTCAGVQIKKQMQDFLKSAENKVAMIQDSIANLEKVKNSLAEFLCEDLDTFRLEECFKVFHSFCQRFRVAIEENERRKQQARKAEIRRRQREEQQTLKRRSLEESRPVSTSGLEPDRIMDRLLGDIRSGFPLHISETDASLRKAKRISAPDSLSLDNFNVLIDDDGGSPKLSHHRADSLNCSFGSASGDISEDSTELTPGSSPRRRRMRISSGDQDNNLIEYLKNTAETEGRDRRSWGSVEGPLLDRTPTRRSGTGRRRRHEVLSEDSFRERETSPTIALEDSFNGEVESKQLIDKVDDWLQDADGEEIKRNGLSERQTSQDIVAEVQNLTKHTVILSPVVRPEVRYNLDQYTQRTKDKPSTPATEKAVIVAENGKMHGKRGSLNNDSSHQLVDIESKRSKGPSKSDSLTTKPDGEIGMQNENKEIDGTILKKDWKKIETSVTDLKIPRDSKSKEDNDSPISRTTSVQNGHENYQKPVIKNACLLNNEIFNSQSPLEKEMNSSNAGTRPSHLALSHTYVKENKPLANLPTKKVEQSSINSYPSLLRGRPYQSMRIPETIKIREEPKRMAVDDIVTMYQNHRRRPKEDESSNISDLRAKDPIQLERITRRSIRYRNFLDANQQIDGIENSDQKQGNTTSITSRGSEDDLGEGQFERFSPSRRTTRRSRLRQKQINSSELEGDQLGGRESNDSSEKGSIMERVTDLNKDDPMNSVGENRLEQTGSSQPEPTVHDPSDTTKSGTTTTESGDARPSLRSRKSRLARRLDSLTTKYIPSSKVKSESEDIQHEASKDSSLVTNDAPSDITTPDIGLSPNINGSEIHLNESDISDPFYKVTSPATYKKQESRTVPIFESRKQKSSSFNVRDYVNSLEKSCIEQNTTKNSFLPTSGSKYAKNKISTEKVDTDFSPTILQDSGNRALCNKDKEKEGLSERKSFDIPDGGYVSQQTDKRNSDTYLQTTNVRNPEKSIDTTKQQLENNVNSYFPNTQLSYLPISYSEAVFKNTKLLPVALEHKELTPSFLPSYQTTHISHTSEIPKRFGTSGHSSNKLQSGRQAVPSTSVNNVKTNVKISTRINGLSSPKLKPHDLSDSMDSLKGSQPQNTTVQQKKFGIKPVTNDSKHKRPQNAKIRGQGSHLAVSQSKPSSPRSIPDRSLPKQKLPVTRSNETGKTSTMSESESLQLRPSSKVDRSPLRSRSPIPTKSTSLTIPQSSVPTSRLRKTPEVSASTTLGFQREGPKKSTPETKPMRFMKATSASVAKGTLNKTVETEAKKGALKRPTVVTPSARLNRS